MNREKKLVPKLRFPGFEGEWVEKRLGEVGESFEYGLNAAATDYDGKNKYLRITDIDDSSHEFKTDALTSPNVSVDLAENYRLQVDDLVFARTGASVGKTYRYKQSDGIVYYAGFLIKASIIKSFDTEFIFQNTLTKKYDNFIKITSQRSGQPGVNAQEYKQFKLFIPNLIEQQKIGAFFQQLDDSIALQQRKLSHLQAQKKGLLQKMFPKAGQALPELRFPGFEGAWVERKLGEVTKSYSGGTPSVGKSEYYDGDIPFIRSAEINSDSTELFISKSGLINSSSKMVEIGDILYALYGATSGEVSISRINGAINQAILAIQPKVGYDSQFLMQWLRSQKQKIIDKYLQGGQGNLSGSIVKDLQIEFPCYIEQKQIGQFFKSIDNLITLHQRKLEHLQTRKKALLQQMFI
jgi:type I restriction enzyme S subunit